MDLGKVTPVFNLRQGQSALLEINYLSHGLVFQKRPKGLGETLFGWTDPQVKRYTTRKPNHESLLALGGVFPLPFSEHCLFIGSRILKENGNYQKLKWGLWAIPKSVAANLDFPQNKLFLYGQDDFKATPNCASSPSSAQPMSVFTEIRENPAIGLTETAFNAWALPDTNDLISALFKNYWAKAYEPNLLVAQSKDSAGEQPKLVLAPSMMRVVAYSMKKAFSSKYPDEPKRTDSTQMAGEELNLFGAFLNGELTYETLGEEPALGWLNKAVECAFPDEVLHLSVLDPKAKDPILSRAPSEIICIQNLETEGEPQIPLQSVGHFTRLGSKQGFVALGLKNEDNYFTSAECQLLSPFAYETVEQLQEKISYIEDIQGVPFENYKIGVRSLFSSHELAKAYGQELDWAMPFICKFQDEIREAASAKTKGV